MKIYIPQHLKKLPIIDQMDRLIRGYAEYIGNTNQEDILPSTYSYDLLNDPVCRFLSLCMSLSGKNLISPENKEEDVIKYLTRLFYSVKGTVKVFEYMKKYLGLEIVGDIIYTVDYVEIRITGLSLTDEGNFTYSFRNFLSSLIYFRELVLELDDVDITIRSVISNSVGTNNIIYKVFDVEPL